MLRRIASLGFDGPEAPPGDSMSPPSLPLPPGDDVAPSPEPKSAGGLASVFKGLTSAAKLVKPPPVPSSSTDTVSAQLSSERVDTTSLAASGLPFHHGEALERLRNGSLSERTAAAESLRLFIADYPLAPVLQIWDAGKDLIEGSKPYNARVAGWELLTECARNPSSTDLERNEYFQTLSAPAHPDDFHLQLAALMELTGHGRSLSGFDYEVIPLLTTWLHDSYSAVKSARKQTMSDRKSSKGKGVAVPFVASAEEKNFSRLFAFILEVLKFNFRVADDDTLGRLIDTLLDISTNTNVENDLTACIDVIDAIITYASIPKRNLGRCVEVLSSAFCIVEKLGKIAWHTLSHLLKSHNGQATVRILLGILRDYPHKDQDTQEANRSVRGSLTVLQKLIWKSTERGYPTVPLSLLLDGCNNIVERTPSTRVVGCVLKLFNILFNDGEQHLSPLLEDEDWTFLLEVAEKCVGRLPSQSTPTRYTSSTSKEGLKKGDTILSELDIFLLRLEELFQQRRSDFIQRQECIAFLARIPHVLQDSTAELVLDHFKEFRCCYPSDLEWEKSLDLVMTSFYLDRNRSTALRSAALRAITEVYDMLELVEDELDEDVVPNIVRSILSEISHETDTLVLQLTVSFMVSVAVAADPALFDYIVDTLKGVITSERLQSPIAEKDDMLVVPDHPGSLPTQSPADVVTRGYVQLFMKTMNTDGRKAAKTFSLLVYTAKLGRSTDATLTAMKLLFRVRADWANRIYLTSFTESEGLAGVLHRTEASLARKLAEDAVMPHRSRSEYGSASRLSRGVSFTSTAQDRLGPSRSASSAKPQHYQQLWSLPDADALPEIPSPNASSVLFSCTENQSDPVDMGDEQITEQPSGVLNIGSWLEAVLHNLTQGSDWEVYSFNLVHLSSQLSNHALFRDAVFQIREARRLLCEQSKHSLFQDPPPATGLRRPEVNICIFQILTTIMSYHQHFQKSDEDDLVRTFMQGIGHSTAKTCIHALTICCHELPLATTKALVTILQKMSTVITQANVAMHILEFLAGLARMPVLYSNFIEEEFRIVFGMCFRYLDTVRDKKRYGRVSTGENVVATINATHEYNMLGQPTTSDDLPQYVHALAYHVIIFWFLALRLSDRAKHVGWIAKRLFQGPDGSLVSDEQAIITIDYMQRVAFADADESEENPRFSPRKAPEYTERRWLIANCLVSIKQSKNTPWAQVTKRQPSGTSYFTVRENFKPPPPHQAGTFGESRDRGSLTTNSALPSHLLVHLLSSIPQCYDPALRPLLLPDEEAIDRSIRTFDRISTVDGHKVGVVYIGENQAHETEILANVSGSADYITFLNGMGTLTKLKGADFNTQGLDREYDTDGQYTFCWRDRVTEIVFHVTTQMPTNLDHDPQCISKKRHIGNDFVNIIFNDSGLPFKFDTFPSEFNYVNIVITPESRASFVATREHAGEDAAKDPAEDGHGRGVYVPFFKVQVMSKEGFPEISPCAATKMVSLRALPDFVRLLALNASVFSVVWSNREQGEPPSAWRSRLREINRLRERHGPGPGTTPGTAPSSSSSSTIVAPGPPPPLSFGTSLASVQQSQQSQQQQQQQAGGPGAGAIDSRPSSGAARDSISALSLRRTSVATFLTTSTAATSAAAAGTATDQNPQSHRSSVVSNSAAEAEMMMQAASLDYLVESLDFSRWA